MTDVILKAQGRNGAPASIDEYKAAGGYAALTKTLTDLKSDELIQLVKDSGLRGRGGAGFPSGMKWSFVGRGDKWDGGPKYLLCNADEMEPGTFKDRVIFDKNPHILIEGMLLAAFGMEMTEGYVFIRREYFRQADDFEKALDEARRAGMLGKTIGGTKFSFDIHVHRSGGRYICGEETALINSLEGRRANPRAKPPFPAIAGLWGKPTVVNNVETLYCVPHIINFGAAWFHDLNQGRCQDGVTKLYGVSGREKNTGVWELPIGTTAREILEVHGGGMKDGLKLKAWLPGGASTDFLMPEHLDLAMDFDTIAKAGSRMGTGLLTVVDDKQNMVSVVRNLEDFFARESCGWCTPCRDGLPWTHKLLLSLEAGQGQKGDIEVLEQMTRFLGPGKTFCAHEPGAMEPLQSALKFFRGEFEAGIASVSAKAAA